MIDRTDMAICCCCSRAAVGFGYTPGKGKPIIWLCDDPECWQLAKDTYHMKQDEFTRIEALAAARGGDEAGAYLDQIGKTDLASLSPSEWSEFCFRLIGGYRKALKSDLQNEAPF